MECFSLTLVKNMPEPLSRSPRPKGHEIELRNPVYDQNQMIGFGHQIIKAIGNDPTPSLFVGSRMLHQLSDAANLNTGRDMVHVQDVLENSVNLSPEIACGIRYLATCLQLADSSFLRGHAESYGTLVQVEVQIVNSFELRLRPYRNMRVTGERALDSLLRGEMSFSRA